MVTVFSTRGIFNYNVHYLFSLYSDTFWNRLILIAKKTSWVLHITSSWGNRFLDFLSCVCWDFLYQLTVEMLKTMINNFLLIMVGQKKTLKLHNEIIVFKLWVILLVTGYCDLHIDVFKTKYFAFIILGTNNCRSSLWRHKNIVKGSLCWSHYSGNRKPRKTLMTSKSKKKL